MIEKFSKKGFVIVCITGEPKGDTEKYVEETKLKAPVVFENGLKSMKEFGFEGLPSSALIGPKGNVIWTGHPGELTEKLIEENLDGVTLGPPPDKLMIDCELPKKYASAAKLLSTGKLGEGRKALATAVAAKDVKEEDKTQLEAALAEVDALLEQQLAAAETAVSEKRYFDAQATWKKVSAASSGIPAQKTADQKLADLAKDASVKKELEAGARIAEAQKLAAAGKTKQALSILTALSENHLKDTEEAKRAKTLVEELKKA